MPNRDHSGQIYAIGDYYSTKQTRTMHVEVYSQRLNKWFNLMEIPLDRFAAECFILDKELLILGGIKGSTTVDTVSLSINEVKSKENLIFC